jgi:hypothetical protein
MLTFFAHRTPPSADLAHPRIPPPEGGERAGTSTRVAYYSARKLRTGTRCSRHILWNLTRSVPNRVPSAPARSFAAALFPCKKDEDRVHVSGGIPGICDAVLQLYDGKAIPDDQ